MFGRDPIVKCEKGLSFLCAFVGLFLQRLSGSFVKLLKERQAPLQGQFSSYGHCWGLLVYHLQSLWG